MKISPVQKQTQAGQRTRFKAFVIVGDGKGHVGLGVKCASEVANAIRGALIDAKLSVTLYEWDIGVGNSVLLTQYQ
jgi:small subunit ribosomal protein S2e